MGSDWQRGRDEQGSNQRPGDDPRREGEQGSGERQGRGERPRDDPRREGERGAFRRDGAPRGFGFRRDDEGQGGRGWQPFQSPRARDDRPRTDRPFERDAREGGRPAFRDRDDREGGRPAFRDRDDRPRTDRPFERDAREGGRPAFRDRDDREGGRPAFRDREQPFRRQPGEPQREQRGEREQPFQDRQGGDERAPYWERSPGEGRNRFEREERPRRFGGDDQRRPPFRDTRGEGRPYARAPFERDRPFRERRDDGERPYGRRPGDEGRGVGERRFGQDRPPYREEGRSAERHEERAPWEREGRPLGTATRLGRNPVSEFERIQADVYGRWPVLESLRAGKVTRIYLAAGVKDSADHLQEIQTLAAQTGIPVVRVERFALDRVVSNANHQGIAAACKPYEYADLETVLQAAGQKETQPLLVVFDGVQDPQNLGSILRTAEAAGVQGAILPKHQQAGVTPAVLRASAGAAGHLPVAEVTNLRQCLDRLKEDGYWIVGLDMEGGTDYDNFEVDVPLALLIGGEGRGLGRLVAEQCDYLVKLPMRGRVASLNASVAAGIVLYEIGRRRSPAAGRVAQPGKRPRPLDLAEAAERDVAVMAEATDEVAREIEAGQVEIEPAPPRTNAGPAEAAPEALSAAATPEGERTTSPSEPAPGKVDEAQPAPEGQADERPAERREQPGRPEEAS